MKVSVNGINASDGKEVNLNGTLKWLDDNGGTNVKMLIDSNNQTYLVGLYKSVPEADIYIKTLSIETDGSKYDNLVEFKVKPANITSLDALVSKIPANADYELSTEISTDPIETAKLQEISNIINGKDKRVSIKTSDLGENTQIKLTKANGENIHDANSVLGSINGISDEITIRVYNCSDSQLNAIKNNYEVVNIRNF